jgi:hypothetical protein
MLGRLFFGAAFALTIAGLSGQSAQARCDPLPLAVKQYEQAHSGWSIVTLQDLAKEDQELWKQHKNNQCPGLTRVNLEGSMRVSFALALLSHAKPSRLETLVVLRPVDDHFVATTLATEEISNPKVVWRGAPGRDRDRTTGMPIFIPHECIVFEDMESTSTVYYLFHGKFRTAVISE